MHFCGIEQFISSLVMPERSRARRFFDFLTFIGKFEDKKDFYRVNIREKISFRAYSIFLPFAHILPAFSTLFFLSCGKNPFLGSAARDLIRLVYEKKSLRSVPGITEDPSRRKRKLLRASHATRSSLVSRK